MSKDLTTGYLGVESMQDSNEKNLIFGQIRLAKTFTGLLGLFPSFEYYFNLEQVLLPEEGQQ